MERPMTQSNQTTSSLMGVGRVQLIPNALLIYSFIANHFDSGSEMGFVLQLVGLGLGLIGMIVVRNYYQGIGERVIQTPQFPTLTKRRLVIIVISFVLILALCVFLSVVTSSPVNLVMWKVRLYRLTGVFMGAVWFVIGWLSKRRSEWLLGLLLLVVSADLFNWLVSDRFFAYGGIFFIWGGGRMISGLFEHVELVRSGQWPRPGTNWKPQIGIWLLWTLIGVYVVVVGWQFLRFAVFAPHVTQVGELNFNNETGVLLWHDMAVNGRFLHLAQDGTLYTIDAAAPTSPVLLNTFTLPTDGSLVEVANGIAYIHDRVEQLSIVDVSDPAVPALLSEASYPANTLAIADSLLYLVGNTAISILDVRDPSQPTLLAQIQVGVAIRHFAINGRFAYAATNAELILIDLSTPTAPQEIERYTLETRYASIDTMTVLGDMIYLLVSRDQLYIFQQVDGVLSLLNEFQLPDSMEDVVVQDNLFYGLHYDELHLIDISNPQRPYRVGWYELPRWTEQLAVWGSQIFITHEDEGLLVYQLQP